MRLLLATIAVTVMVTGTAVFGAVSAMLEPVPDTSIAPPANKLSNLVVSCDFIFFSFFFEQIACVELTARVDFVFMFSARTRSACTARCPDRPSRGLRLYAGNFANCPQSQGRTDAE